MDERKIPVKAIEYLLGPTANIVSIPSKVDPEIELIIGLFEQKGYVIIINHKSQVIVTLRRARRNELALLNKENLA